MLNLLSCIPNQDDLTVIQEGAGGGAILLNRQDGTYSVTSATGRVHYTGDEVGAEFAFWRQEFGCEGEVLP